MEENNKPQSQVKKAKLAGVKEFFKKLGAGFKKLTSSKWGIAGLSAAALALIVGAVLLIFVVPNRSAASEPGGETEPPPEFSIDESLYAGTVLQQTGDAGQRYVTDTLLIGDSNTLRYHLYGLLDIENLIGVEGMSIAQVKNLSCVYFVGMNNPIPIPDALEMIQPQRIILNFGTNNLVDDTPENFKKSYGEVIDVLQDAYPYATIIIQSIHPVGPTTSHSRLNRENVIAFNEVLLELAKERDLKFLNTFETLVDAKTGYIKSDYAIGDGIHLTKDALNACLSYMRTHSYETEDTRPKPLGDCPARRPAPYVPPEGEDEVDFSPDVVLAYARETLGSNGLSSPPSMDAVTKIDGASYSYSTSPKPASGKEQEVSNALMGVTLLPGDAKYYTVSYSGSLESGYTFTVTLYKDKVAEPPPDPDPPTPPDPDPPTPPDPDPPGPEDPENPSEPGEDPDPEDPNAPGP